MRKLLFIILVFCFVSTCEAKTFTYFDNDYWNISGVGSWDEGNQEWDSAVYGAGNYIFLSESSDWNEGFRPSHVIITADTAEPLYIVVKDTISYTLDSTFTLTSGVPVSLTFGGNDLKSITVACLAESFSITNIVFTGYPDLFVSGNSISVSSGALVVSGGDYSWTPPTPGTGYRWVFGGDYYLFSGDYYNFNADE